MGWHIEPNFQGFEMRKWNIQLGWAQRVDKKMVSFV